MGAGFFLIRRVCELLFICTPYADFEIGRFRATSEFLSLLSQKKETKEKATHSRLLPAQIRPHGVNRKLANKIIWLIRPQGSSPTSLSAKALSRL